MRQVVSNLREASVGVRERAASTDIAFTTVSGSTPRKGSVGYRERTVDLDSFPVAVVGFLGHYRTGVADDQRHLVYECRVVDHLHVHARSHRPGRTGLHNVGRVTALQEVALVHGH